MNDHPAITRRRPRGDDRYDQLNGRLTELVGALRGMTTNHVLFSGTILFPTSGVVEKNWTVPYGSVAVMNVSGATVTVADAPAQDSIPRFGTGVVTIVAGDTAVIPLTGRVLSIYGPAGAQVYLGVFDMLLPPSFASGAAADASGTDRVSIYGKNVTAGDTPVAVNASGQLVTAAAAPGASSIYSPGAQSPAASGNSGDLNVNAVSTLAVDVNVTAITGGTAPTVQFILERKGLDGNYYAVWTSAALAATGPVSTSIGPGAAVTAVLTGTVRLRWVFGGTVAPTSVTFTASIAGR